MRLHLIAEFANELVWDHKDEDLCSFDGVCDVWDSDLREASEQSVSTEIADAKQDLFSLLSGKTLIFLQLLLLLSLDLTFIMYQDKPFMMCHLVF